MSNFHDLQRELKQLQRDCTAIVSGILSGHDEAMAHIQRLYHPNSIGSSTPTPSAPPAPTEKRWKYLGEDGLISPELSLRAARDPGLFAEICEEIQQATDAAKRQD